MSAAKDQQTRNILHLFERKHQRENNKNDSTGGGEQFRSTQKKQKVLRKFGIADRISNMHRVCAIHFVHSIVAQKHVSAPTVCDRRA